MPDDVELDLENYPEALAAVAVSVPGGDVLPTIVLRREGREIVVEAPCAIPESPLPQPDDLVELRWAGGGGRFRLVASVVFAGDTWRLRGEGFAVWTQERHHSRVALKEPITLRTGRATLQGLITELSEGGLRCRLQAGTAYLLAAGEGVAVDTELDGYQIVGRARVKRVGEIDGGHEVLVALEFTELTPATVVALRKLVRTEQLMQRRGL
jgi:hypothetical protein